MLGDRLESARVDPNMSLLGHLVLAQRFTAHPENLATEALGYILTKSPAARRAFHSFLKGVGISPPDLAFRSQASGEDGSIPDLVGIDTERREFVIVEAKFDAGLTDNQPVAYLNRLPAGQAAVLVFVAPAWRRTLLWAELVGRCRGAGVDLGEERSVSSELIYRKIGEHHLLVLVSWRILLNHLHFELNAEGDRSATADVAQMQGLCDRMDQAAFLPIRSEELTPAIPSRLLQLNGVVDDVAERAFRDGLAVVGGNRSGGAGQYSRPMVLSEFGCYLQVSSQHWSSTRSTPLWFLVQDIRPDRAWVLTPRVRNALAQLEHEDPPRVVYGMNEALIPITVPLGVERPAVVEGVFQQLLAIAEFLRGARTRDA